MTDLFNIPETLSPRLQWLKKYEVKTHFSKDMEEDPWAAWSGDLEEAIQDDAVGVGPTEDESITDLAKLNGWLLWNEEGATKCL